MKKLNELIPVTPGNIGGESATLVSAKQLHAFLCVGRDFTTWIKGRIDQYGFIAGVDFIAADSLRAPVYGSANVEQFTPERGKTSGGGRPGTDYLITTDMGKELAMVERNEKGREVRRYFIQCERQAKAAAPVPPSYPEALRLAADLSEKATRLENLLVAAAPKVDFVNRFVISNGSMGFREVAKLLNVKETVLRQFLSDNGIMYMLAGNWTPYSNHIEAGRFTVKTGESTSNGHAFTQAKFTPKGVEWLAQKMVSAGLLGGDYAGAE
ncbi:phage antirepressor KilAC domain-containing protein [Rahnella laticis]|uniref:phage antirepressor KilAC domain-containing protein n=1 Tax=Rahnella laticis TaxID=2787622 RepID=UPI0018A2CB01|nr:phage antirepressor KilAC domain-containing protein [Rahnella laticis]MBF7996657.1 phage antirepressor KilAC domain-containing protein [Rahnella laticis]